MSDTFTHQFKVAENHRCFEGHFPGFPVFPAVGQLSLLTETISLRQGGACAIGSVPAVKFLRPITPGMAVYVELKSTGENCADFVIGCTEGLVAKGKVTYRILES